eukprot:1194140-Prorocentrum_minimum.AAC.2
METTPWNTGDYALLDPTRLAFCVRTKGRVNKDNKRRRSDWWRVGEYTTSEGSDWADRCAYSARSSRRRSDWWRGGERAGWQLSGLTTLCTRGYDSRWLFSCGIRLPIAAAGARSAATCVVRVDLSVHHRRRSASRVEALRRSSGIADYG